MKHLYHLVASTLLGVTLSFTANAQSDSTYLDLGRTKLRRDLTQHITIKGEDLEKMAFANLSDAIRGWLSGIAIESNNLVYVIDGTLIQDVNTYQVHDIEEVNLVYNTLGQVNGATGAKMMVVITTRRNKENAPGITVAGQTGYIRSSIYPLDFAPEARRSAGSGFYSQLTLSTQKDIKNVRLGFSANYLRDANPSTELVRTNSAYSYSDGQFMTYKPSHTNRIRLNSFAQTNLGEKHTLFVAANYAAQTNRLSYQRMLFSRAQGSPDPFDPSFPRVSPNPSPQPPPQPVIIDTSSSAQASNMHLLSSEARLTSRFNEHFNNILGISYQLSSGSHEASRHSRNSSNVHNGNRSHNALLVTNRFSYIKQAGGWSIEPALNMSMRLDNYISKVDENSRPLSHGHTLRTALLFTPTLHLGYKDIFYTQMGTLSVWSHTGTKSTTANYASRTESSPVLPFFSTSLDVLRLFSASPKISWKVYSSGTAYPQFNEQPTGIESMNEYNHTWNVYPGRLTYPNGATINQYSAQLGSSIGLLGNRLTFNYSINYRQWAARRTFYTGIEGVRNRELFNWLGLSLKMIENEQTQWTTQFNVSTLPDPSSFGWVNRFRHKAFSAGFDIVGLPGRYSTFESLRFQHLYIGHQVQARGVYPLNIYLFSQSIQTGSYDSNLYVGVGFKTTL